LKIKDNSGTSSEYNETSKVMVINYPPVAKSGEDQWVTSSEVSFDASASSDYDGEITKYLWDFGDSFKSGEKMPVHIYSNPGKYLVKLTVTDDSKTSTKDHSDNLTVIVNSVPIADAGNDKISAPQEILKFDGSKSSDLDGEISSYEWDFGDGSSASGAKTSHSYAKPGIYSVTLTVRDNTGHTNAVSSDEAMVIVNQAPFALAGRDKVAAPGDKLVFDAFASYDSDGKVKSYHWEFSYVKNPSDLSRVERTFEEAGSYFAELTVTDNSGAINAVSKDKLDILINHPPQSNPGSDVFTNNLSVIFDGSASADADGDKLSYVWNLGDGSPMVSGAKIAHTYKKGGIYPVILTVDDGTGLKNAKNSATINIRINEAPVAVAGKDTTVCAGDMILFHGSKSSDPEGGVLKYFWDFGDDTKGEGINPTKVFDKGGVYTITLKVLDDTGFPENFDTDKMVVSVAESPIAYAGEDITAGVSEEIHFDGSQSTDLDGLVNSYNWDFGDGSSGGGPTPRHAYLEPGVYRVILTITGDKIGECSNQDSDDLMVTVHDAPVANFTCKKLVPVDLEVEFDGSGSKSKMAEISGWSWDFGDSAIAEGEKVSHIYTTPGRYIVTLKVTSDSQTGYNTGTVQNLIVVNSAPQSNAGEDKFVGIGQLVWFDGSGSSDVDGAITYYQWDFGDGITAEGVKARHQYVLSGRYSATLLLYDNSGLENKSDIDTLLVTVNEAPTPVIDCVARATVEESIEFNGANSYDADGVITGYYWDFADGAYGEGQKVQHSFARAGSYQVSLTVDDGYSLNNRRSTVIKNVIINHPPVPVAGNDRISAPEEMVEFDAGKSFDKDGVITQYKWDFADGNSIEGIKVGHIFAHPGIYNVVLTVTDDSETKSGMQSDTVQIQINSAPIAEGGTDREAFFGGAHDDVAFDAGLSSDPDGDPLTYVWEFGDGTSAKGARVSHKYLKPGKYTVNLKVDDNTGAKNRMSIDQFTVTVKSH
jgi:PKD repeat protein